MKISYWTKSKGTGGRIRSPEDFVVREIIGRKFLRRYSIGKKISKPKKYNLLLIRKRDITTKSAIRKLAEYSGIPENYFGYAGLKDKFSVSYQYLTVNGDRKIEKISLDNVEIIEITKSEKFLSKGDLVCNEFEITLHGCKRNPEKIVAELAKGMPNFFGPQRFGRHGDNHVIGRLLLKRQFDVALEIINSHGKYYQKIKDVKKDVLKFYIHAYQSSLFNMALNEYMKCRKPYFRDVRIPGCNTKLGNNKIEMLMKKFLEKDKINQKDFMINELRMSVSGANRTAFIKVSVKYQKQKDKVRLYFTLPKGSYATIVTGEITKPG